MAPTIVGTNEVTALSRHIILPYITDTVYPSNALYYRAMAANRKNYEGGTHVEIPWMYQKLTNGGAYDGGYEVVDVSPNETVRNGALDMKHYEVPITIDRRTLKRMNTKMAIVNELTKLAEQARMHMAYLLGLDLSRSEGSSGTGSDLKKLTGLAAIVDAGGSTTEYAGLTRAAYTWLNAQINSTTTTLTQSALRAQVSSQTFGGHTPTLIRSRTEQYDRYWALCLANQRLMAGQGGSDAQLANAGFKNLTFDGIPWIVDDAVIDGPNTSNSRIEFLNENVIEIAVFMPEGQDFELTEWRKPVDQPGAMTQFLLTDLEVICTNPQLQGAMTAIAA